MGPGRRDSRLGPVLWGEGDTPFCLAPMACEECPFAPQHRVRSDPYQREREEST